MKSRGMGGVLDESHPKPTRDAFVNNFKSLRENERALAQLKQSNSKNSEKLNYLES